MSALFRIGQSGVFEAYGRARDDVQPFSVGGIVTLEAQDLTHATYTWSVFGKPIDGVAPVLIPAGGVCTAQLEERGGYLIQLVVDAGLPTEDVDILYVGLPLANSGLPLPAEYETNQDNVPLPHDGSQGWWYKLERWMKWADALIGSGGLGNLPQTQTVYVDGGRTDVYVEDGTFGFPFKALQPGINLAAFLADSVSGEACVHVRPWQYTDVNVVLPSNVHIDAEMGASLIPVGPSYGLIVIPGNFRTQLGVTIVRGLSFAGNGGGIWPNPFPMWALYLPLVPPPPGVDPPVVFPIDCGIGALQNACGIGIEQGAVYLTDAGGMFSDFAGGTNAIAARVGPPGGGPPLFGAILMVGMFNLSASETMFDILPGGGVLATGTSLANNTGPLSDALIRIDGGAIPGLGALFVGKNLRTDGDMSSMVKQTGNSFVLLDTSAGGIPTMGNFVDDIFDIRQGSLLLAGGAYRTTGGNGLALRATDGPVRCWTRDTDIIADDGVNDVQVLLTENEVDLQTYNTRFRGENLVPGRTYARMAHTLGGAYLDGGIIEGGSGGGLPATTLALVSGMTWLTGGIDLNANQWNDLALHVGAGAAVLHGHANVRVGQVVVDPGGTDYALPSSFGGIQVGRYDSLIKFVARATLAEVAFEPDYPHGSLVVVTGDPARPVIYFNYGTDAARDWRLLWDYVRIQTRTVAATNLNGATELAPTPIVWGHADYDDDPPYSFTAPSYGIVITHDGDYRLSHHLTFKNSAILAFGCSVAARWQYSIDFGGTWVDIEPTTSMDSVPNIINSYGSVDLAPYEIHFAANTWVRLVAFLSGANGDVVVNDSDEDWSWARIEKGGVGATGGGGGTDWTVEFVTANRVLNAADHKKTLVVLVDTPNTVTLTLPATPFVGQELRIVHGGQLTFPGPGSGHLTITPAVPGDKGIGVSDSDYSQLDAEGGGSVVHLLCIDAGAGYWGSRFWGCGDGSGEWWDATHLGIHPAPPYMSNQFYLNFQSPFNISAGGPSSIQLNEPSCEAYGVFSLAFGYIAQTLMEYSEAFGCNVQANWVGEAVRSGGGFHEFGSAQSSRINLYCHTDAGGTPSTDLTPTGIGGFPLTVLPNKVYACEVLLVAAMDQHLPGDTLCAAWKLEFLVHGGSPGSNAMLVGTLNKLLFSRDPNPIIDTWDVNVTVGGPGPLATDIKITVTQGAAPGLVRWDAELNMAQVIVTDNPT